MKIKNHLKMKLKNKNSLEFSSWDEFIKFVNEHKQELKRCICRGQCDQEWKLTPSFFRQIPAEFDKEKLQNIAYNHHLENFKKFTRGRHGISYTDPNDKETDWWALGQHYGLKTPLLDWVRSPYVAAFFGFIEEEAKESDKKSRAIFILDIEKVKEIWRESHRGGEYNMEIIDPLTHENKRLVSQQGIFTYIHGYKHENIESFLKEFQDQCKTKIEEDEIFLLKIMIPSSERRIFLEQLDLMNINKSTLFPDLTGSAEYCNYLLNTEIS